MTDKERVNLIDKKIDAYLDFLDKKEINDVASYKMNDENNKVKTTYVKDFEILLNIEKLISLKQKFNS